MCSKDLIPKSSVSRLSRFVGARDHWHPESDCDMYVDCDDMFLLSHIAIVVKYDGTVIGLVELCPRVA